AEPLPPDRPTHRWEPGSMVRLAFRAYLRADDHDADRQILRDVHGWLADRPLRPALRIDEAAALAAEGLMRWHFRPSDGVLIETAGFDRGSRAAATSTRVTLDDEPGSAPGDRLAMHVAWLSGAPAAAALVAHGLRLGQADL